MTDPNNPFEYPDGPASAQQPAGAPSAAAPTSAASSTGSGDGQAAGDAPAAAPYQSYTPAPEYGAYAPQTPGAGPLPTYSAPSAQAQPGAPYAPQPQSAPQTPYAAPQGNPYATQPTYTAPQAQPGAPYVQPAQQASYGDPYAQPGQSDESAQQTGPQPAYGAPYAQPGQPLPQGMGAYGYGQGYGPGYQQPFTAGEPPLDQPWYGIGFIPAVQRFFLKYATFSGRASRGEFWWIILFFVLAGIVLSMITGFLPFTAQIVVSGIWTLATLVPYLAVAVRRLHDTNKSGWWVLLPAVPYVVGEIISFIWTMRTMPVLSSMMHVMATGNEAQAEQILNMLPSLMAPAMLVFVLELVYLISGLVLMTGRTKPEGARFDAPQPQPQAQQPPQQPQQPEQPQPQPPQQSQQQTSL